MTPPTGILLKTLKLKSKVDGYDLSLFRWSNGFEFAWRLYS